MPSLKLDSHSSSSKNINSINIYLLLYNKKGCFVVNLTWLRPSHIELKQHFLHIQINYARWALCFSVVLHFNISPSFFRCSECCYNVWLWSASKKLHWTFLQHRGEKIMTEFSFFSEQLLWNPLSFFRKESSLQTKCMYMCIENIDRGSNVALKECIIAFSFGSNQVYINNTKEDAWCQIWMGLVKTTHNTCRCISCLGQLAHTHMCFYVR